MSATSRCARWRRVVGCNPGAATTRRERYAGSAHAPVASLRARRWAMAETAADVLIETIHDWGVDVVFGMPGDGINGIMEALRTRQDRIRFVQVRHEESAAFMACGYAKFTGKLAACLATSGPEIGRAHV